MRRDDDLEEIAGRVADGEPVDWPAAAETAGDDRERVIVEQLKVVEQIARFHPSAAIPRVGDSWAHLKLLEQISESQYGVVFRAWDTTLDREVALKLVHCDHDQPSDAVHAIEEARLLARIRHPNVVTIHGATRATGCAGLWMEFIRGRTLDDLLRELGRFGAGEAALVGVSICRALAAVHAVRIVHGDVKAHNVMRETGGRIVLMDFGSGHELITGGSAQPVAGTPLYLAPELLRGEGATARSDLYALGVLLYHLVTAAYPIDAATLAEARDAHRAGRLRWLHETQPDLPPRFLQAVERALQGDPARRYGSAGEMAASLIAAEHDRKE